MTSIARPNESVAVVSRTIVKSSLVEMTRIRPGEVTTGDVRIGLAVRVGGGSSSNPRWPRFSQTKLPHLRGILADAGGEDQSINPAQRCGHRADGLHQPVDIDFQSQASVRMLRSLLQNFAHVRRNPRKAEQAGLVVQGMVRVVPPSALCVARDRAARPGPGCRCECP